MRKFGVLDSFGVGNMVVVSYFIWELWCWIGKGKCLESDYNENGCGSEYTSSLERGDSRI